MYCTVGSVKVNSLSSLSSDKLIKMWIIGLKSMIETFDTRTNECIRSTGLLENQFKTYKYQLRYKSLSCRYSTFYVDYLKVVVKSVRQFIGVTFILTNLDSINY